LRENERRPPPGGRNPTQLVHALALRRVSATAYAFQRSGCDRPADRPAARRAMQGLLHRYARLV